MSILGKIVAQTRKDIERRMDEVSTRLDIPNSDRDFSAALRNDGLSLIAEVKHKSPSRGVIREDFDPAKIEEDVKINGYPYGFVFRYTFSASDVVEVFFDGSGNVQWVEDPMTVSDLFNGSAP